MSPSSPAKPLSSHTKSQSSAKPGSRLLSMAAVQKPEKRASAKLLPVAPAGINDSRSRLLLERHSRKKDGPACPIRPVLEEQLTPQETSRTIGRSPKRSRSQGCSPTRVLGRKVMCVSSPNISKVTSPQLPVTAAQEGLRDSPGPWGRRGTHCHSFPSTSPLLRSAASLSDLSLMPDPLTFSVPRPKREFRKGIPGDAIGEDLDSLPSIPAFLPSSGQLPHMQMCHKRGQSLKQCLLPSSSLHPARSNVNLSTLNSLFASCYLSSSLGFLAYPLYSEAVHSSQAFRSPGVPEGKSLQVSSKQPSRPSHLPSGKAPSSYRNIAVGHSSEKAVSSSTPDVRVPGHPKSGPPLVGDIFQGSWLPGSWHSSFGLYALGHTCGNLLSYLVCYSWVWLT